MNFDHPNWESVPAFIDALSHEFRQYEALNEDGADVLFTDPATIAALSPGPHYVHVIFESGRGLVKRLQVYMSSEENGDLFVELTFFPENLDHTEPLKKRFLEWGDHLSATLGARRWFARESSVGWSIGDTGPLSGVFHASIGQADV